VLPKKKIRDFQKRARSHRGNQAKKKGVFLDPCKKIREAERRNRQWESMSVGLQKDTSFALKTDQGKTNKWTLGAVGESIFQIHKRTVKFPMEEGCIGNLNKRIQSGEANREKNGEKGEDSKSKRFGGSQKKSYQRGNTH